MCVATSATLLCNLNLRKLVLALLNMLYYASASLDIKIKIEILDLNLKKKTIQKPSLLAEVQCRAEKWKSVIAIGSVKTR